MRLIDFANYDLQYGVALEIRENENTGPLEDVTESSESDGDHSELEEEVQSSRSHSTRSRSLAHLSDYILTATAKKKKIIK